MNGSNHSVLFADEEEEAPPHVTTVARAQVSAGAASSFEEAPPLVQVVHVVEPRGDCSTSSRTSVPSPLSSQGDSATSSDNSTSNNSDGEEKSIQKQLFKSPLAATGLGLCVSLVAALIGMSLLVYVSLKNNNTSSKNDSSAWAGTTINDLNQTSATDYWREIHDLVRGTDDHSGYAPPPLRRGSPAWRALDWMVRRDPLAGGSSLTTSTTTLLQRYVLAVIYFSGTAPALTNPEHGWLGFVAAADPQQDYTVWYIDGENENKNKTSSATSSPRQVSVPLNECDWLGITCDNQSRVVGLDLSARALHLQWTHPLPSELGLLRDLTHLNLAKQQLVGRIPQLPTSLTHLDLSDNAFTSLPVHMGTLHHLQTVSLARNQLQGSSLPAQIVSRWRHLQKLDVSSNPNLTGNLWQTAVRDHWWDLRELDVSFTQVSGSIPNVVFNQTLSQVEVIHATASHLVGTLPRTLGRATHLTVLSAGDLKGAGMTPRQLPTDYGSLTKLSFLALPSSKALQGSLPKELVAAWTNMEFLDVRFNDLTGTIPTEIGLWHKLVAMQLTHTHLEGTLPSELGQCRQLIDLQVQETDLTGSMPQEVCALKNVRQLIADCGVTVIGSQTGPPKLECNCCTYCNAAF